MSKTKIAVTLEEQSITQLDRLVHEQLFLNRSQAIQQAVNEKIERLGKNRLARACAKLNAAFEQSMAEEGLSEDLSQWPKY